ncbi:2-hydroxyacid dehydrogenase [Algoriphagus sp. D3-2-R+10]|uniref:2-hydroxyacid dehydrogenase n=1 Tax=Algoriphagus aurantiacus TaxID=3103948 RepID=UPI002B3CD13B|nr:2-hydroxyacid dehydrogenase [Algoriphagus sp. D3-2-R+10]MEB2777014.1 2-hydroxyacid dehydrogenase [Algoriphagus sp. D3-2-R+10]
MKVAFFSTKSYDKQSFDHILPDHSHEFTYFEPKLDSNTVALSKGYDAICTFVNDKLDEKILNILNEIGVKSIVLRCAGYNQVDLQKAAELGFKICRVPAYSPEAVAEHALALLMTLSRKTHKAYNRVRDNNYSLEGLTGFNINGKTTGVIGTGAIGKAFSRIMLGIGCKVLAYDIKENEELKKQGVTYMSLDELLTLSDIISLHCPLNSDTFHLINKQRLAQMKDGVVLINTSRGALIESKAVIQALKIKKVGNLGIDVYEQEEDLFFQNRSEEILQDEDIARLMTFPNVLITGHQAFLTNEALSQISEITLKNLDELEEGKKLTNEVVWKEA